MTEFAEISLAVDDAVATISLDRPEQLNAFTPRMAREIVAALDECDADDGVRAVIVTGRGRAFCAGADLGSGGDTFDAGAAGHRDDGVPRDTGGVVALRIFNSLKPVIAAINGPAVGIGLTMTLPMDIRLAVPDAKLGFVFARRGIVPEAASSWFLPRLVGIGQAMEWVATGRIFPASEAVGSGLIRSVHEPSELLSVATGLAREIAANTSAVSVTLSRQLLWRGLTFDHPMEAHRADSRGVYLTGRSPDAREGVMSFLEKRPPSFPGLVSADLPDLFPDVENPTY